MNMAKGKCLLVEDELLVGVSTALMLEDVGYDVVGPIMTLDGAIKAANGEAFALAVLDIAIVGGDVFAAADILNARRVPILFHTGHGHRGSLLQTYPDASVLPKPASLEQFIATLASRRA